MLKLLLLSSLFPALVSANPGAPGEFPPHGEFGKPPMPPHAQPDTERLPPILQDLGLSEQQQRDIKSLLKAHLNLMEETRKNDHAEKLQLHQLSYSSAYTEDQAAALIERSLAAHKTKSLRQAQLDHAIFKLLTAGQQTALQAKLAKLNSEHPF